MTQNDFNNVCSLPVFAQLAKHDIDKLLLGSASKTLRHRDVLYRMGETAETFALVTKGALKLVKLLPSGENVIMSFAAPGDFIAILIMSRQANAYPITAVAMGASSVLQIPRQTYLSEWTTRPLVLERVNQLIFSRMTEIQEQKALGKASLAQKVASQIVSLIERFGDENGTILLMPLTRQEIADSVGASVESVIRIMSQWTQQGILRTSEQHLEIIRMDLIAEIIRGAEKA